MTERHLPTYQTPGAETLWGAESDSQGSDLQACLAPHLPTPPVLARTVLSWPRLLCLGARIAVEMQTEKR